MTTRNRIAATIILLLAAHGLCLANEDGMNVMSAENSICDLGHISVKDGPQTCRFRITNNGSDEIEITDAVTSCGCTTVRLPEKPVAPGETVSVEVTYDNKEVTEFFDKRIALRFKGIDTPLLLSVRGSTAKAGRNRFRYACGSLRFEKEEYKVGDVIQGCPASGEMKAIYRGLRPAELEMSSPDEGIRVEAAHTLLRHGDTLSIHFTVITDADDFGTKEYRVFPVRITERGRKPGRKGISIRAVSHAEMCSESYGTCSPELKTGWKQMSLGAIRKGEVRAVEVPVENTGKADLTIYRIDGENISTDCPGAIIKPGESSTFILSLEPKRRRKGKYADTFTVYSNDNIKPEYNLYVTYNLTNKHSKSDHTTRQDSI